MSEYTQGVCEDGAAILKDGKPLTIEEILAELRTERPDVAAMVNRFLCWRLPKNFNPDAGISFNRAQMEALPEHCWPVGTNLFDANQAKAMIEHIVGVE